MGLKKMDSISLKPNIFSIQIFPPLRTTTKPNNHFKQGFYTKRGIPNLQTSILIHIHTKIRTKVPNKFHTLISCLLPSSFFLLLFSSYSSSSSSFPSLLFSFIRFLPYPQRPKDIFCFKIRPCLALSHFLILFPFLHVGPSSSFYLKFHLFKFYFGI